MDENDREIVKGIVYEHLPCSTNKTCKEVVQLKKTIEKVDTRTWMILAGIIISIIIQIASKI